MPKALLDGPDGLSAAEFALGNVKQVAVVYEAGGENVSTLIQHIQSEYRQNSIMASSPYPPSSEAPNLSKARLLMHDSATIYACEGIVCKNPVTSVDDLKKLI